mgnify:CR=1 FL=1
MFWLVAELLRLKGSRSHVFQASLIFGNAGFIGIPLIMALLAAERRDLRGADVDHRPNAALDVRRMAVRAGRRNDWRQRDWRARCGRERFGERRRFGGQCWFASNAANGGSPAIVRPSPGTRVLGLLKRFVNPAFVGVMLALILILLGVKVPDIILKPLHTIGNMATPMSLIYLGGLFALTKWWGVLKRYELYAGLVAKMIAFPLAFYALLTALTAHCRNCRSPMTWC